MRLPLTAILAATTATSVLAAPTTLDDTALLTIALAEKGHKKHPPPVVAKLQRRERDNNGKCTQDKHFTRGKPIHVRNNQCITFDDKADELAQDFSYVPAKELVYLHQDDLKGFPQTTCEIRAYESDNCGSGEIAASHVPRERFWEAASTEKHGYHVPIEGWHLECVPAPKARSVIVQCDLPAWVKM